MLLNLYKYNDTMNHMMTLKRGHVTAGLFEQPVYAHSLMTCESILGYGDHIASQAVL